MSSIFKLRGIVHHRSELRYATHAGNRPHVQLTIGWTNTDTIGSNVAEATIWDDEALTIDKVITNDTPEQCSVVTLQGRLAAVAGSIYIIDAEILQVDRLDE